MFGRFFLITLSVISLGWIVFIGYDLLDKKDQISPQHIFTVQDGEILIINRTSEVQTDKLDFEFNDAIRPVFEKIMKNVFPNERIFVSQKRPIIIVELPRIWNQNLVNQYLKTKLLGDLASTNFSIRFKKNHLLIAQDKSLVAHDIEEWPLWDGKASASLIHLERPLKSTNVYFKEDGTVYYQTKFGPLMDCKKVDDNDYFAQFLPADLSEYHFYEKEYALKNKVISASSPIYQWLEDGMVFFEYDGVACLLTDYNKSVDPMQMLLSDTDQSDNELTNHFKSVQLTKKFPSNLSKGFYIGKVGDKVILSEKKEVMEKIIADYQLGNTLALHQVNLNTIFHKMPKKVSERVALSDDFFALSAYKNLLIRTEIYDAFKAKDSSELLVKKDLTASKIENSSFSTGQETAYFLGNGNVIYAIGKQNEIIALSNKKQIWKLHLDGEIIGQMKFVDANDGSRQNILISTKNKIYLINSQDGSNLNEFPLALNSQNAVSFYKWNGKTNFLAVNSNNELVQITENGRINKKLKLPLSDVKDEVSVYKNGKVLTAVITSSSKVQTVDLDKNRLLKSKIFLPKNHIQLKTESGYNYFVLEGNGVSKYNSLGQKSSVLNSKSIKSIKKVYRGKEQFIAFQDKQTVYLVDANGNFIHKTTLKISDIEDFDMISTTNGKTYIAVLEGIQNDIYIFDSQGNQVGTKTFEGKRIVKLSENQGKLNLTSTLERNIIQHYDVLSE
ncbi:MAG: hypothetical protein ACK5B9_02070 [Flavobacteriia bacterium]